MTVLYSSFNTLVYLVSFLLWLCYWSKTEVLTQHRLACLSKQRGCVRQLVTMKVEEIAAEVGQLADGWPF